MALRDILLSLAGTLFTAFLGWATAVLVPMIKEWLGTRTQELELNNLRSIIWALVRQAEELFKNKPKSGEDKLKYVTDLIEATYDIVDKNIVHGLIEDAVDQLPEREEDYGTYN